MNRQIPANWHLYVNDHIASAASRCDRASLRVIVNEQLLNAGINHVALKATQKPALTWTQQLVADLAERTCNGSIARGTYRHINFYPIPQKLEAARAELAAQGVKFDIQPHASDDGTFMVWVEYMQPQASGS